jgi:hypothetical protein
MPDEHGVVNHRDERDNPDEKQNDARPVDRDRSELAGNRFQTSKNAASDASGKHPAKHSRRE